MAASDVHFLLCWSSRTASAFAMLLLWAVWHIDDALVRTANNKTHTQRQRDMQILSTATATAKTTTYKHATQNIQVIRTKDSPHTQPGTEEQGEAGKRVEIGSQHPEVFPGGPPPQY